MGAGEGTLELNRPPPAFFGAEIFGALGGRGENIRRFFLSTMCVSNHLQVSLAELSPGEELIIIGDRGSEQQLLPATTRLFLLLVPRRV